VCVPVGSGGTFSGLINSSLEKQKILGFSALNNSNISEVINKFVKKDNWKLFEESFFGGYAKFNDELINFINNFYKKHNIRLDSIYNAKMIFRIIDLINKNDWVFGKNILIINTGGTQSVEGINKLLKKKGCETINY
ncbi:MAG: 1-aminocyclopropane-1-carboxylate deaminase/D-cysteine desulfhydrase, partial [Flavobacteriaceae bacterium]|nr:1-aminocyclopropane-1-carboxylate deaminase/D-cysteine desulfhydrase [Flavobacteriaceae bacterium]